MWYLVQKNQYRDEDASSWLLLISLGWGTLLKLVHIVLWYLNFLGNWLHETTWKCLCYLQTIDKLVEWCWAPILISMVLSTTMLIWWSRIMSDCIKIVNRRDALGQLNYQASYKVKTHCWRVHWSVTWKHPPRINLGSTKIEDGANPRVDKMSKRNKYCNLSYALAKYCFRRGLRTEPILFTIRVQLHSIIMSIKTLKLMPKKCAQILSRKHRDDSIKWLVMVFLVIIELWSFWKFSSLVFRFHTFCWWKILFPI